MIAPSRLDGEMELCLEENASTNNDHYLRSKNNFRKNMLINSSLFLFVETFQD